MYAQHDVVLLVATTVEKDICTVPSTSREKKREKRKGTMHEVTEDTGGKASTVAMARVVRKLRSEVQNIYARGCAIKSFLSLLRGCVLSLVPLNGRGHFKRRQSPIDLDPIGCVRAYNC